MVRRSTPASNPWVAQPWRSVWMPVPWGMPAARLAGEERFCAVAMGMGWGASFPGKSHGAGRESVQEARSAAKRRADSRGERSLCPFPD